MKADYITYEESVHAKISHDIRKAELWIEELHSRIGIKVSAKMELLYDNPP